MAEQAAPVQEKMSIVVFSGELDKALAAFILATTGASMGMEVSMFFTFWGLNVLKKNTGPAGGRGFLRKMKNRLNRGSSRRMKLSQLHTMGLGTGMMQRSTKENKLPTIDEFITMAQDMGIKLIPCSTSCGVMGLEEGAFREGTGALAGAAYFLNEARESKVTLFI